MCPNLLPRSVLYVLGADTNSGFVDPNSGARRQRRVTAFHAVDALCWARAGSDAGQADNAGLIVVVAVPDKKNACKNKRTVRYV